VKANGVLERIVTRAREAVLVRRREMPVDRLLARGRGTGTRRPFREALARPDRVNVIAEFKRRSPSRGVIRDDLTPVEAAQAYEVAGAAALSVLTEEQFFGGSLEDLKEARAATLLPVLQKDFVVDPYQVWEAWHAGADAVLLIAAALSDAELRALHATAEEAGLDALVEVHDAEELRRALGIGARLVGVNNRDLRTMTVSLATAFDLAPQIPAGVVSVAESGIRGAADVRRLREAGYKAFLIGEHLLMANDPGAALEELVQAAAGVRRATRGARHRAHVFVKICGITSVEDALAASRAGADAIGLVFWPDSPRAVDVARARRISQALPPFMLRVGVFVNAPPEAMARTAEEVGLDLLQLHGDEPPEALKDLPRRALKALRVGEGFDPQEVVRYKGLAAGILLDTRADGRPGGGGLAFDWSLARGVRERAPFLVLAGGLTPQNVGEAIRSVHPDAVDVSSGVESAPGRKDPDKIRAFIDAVNRAGGQGMRAVAT
jgi:indole-3-glycerol phosphate synthase/phosphoribosylanthranilate isomerase